MGNIYWILQDPITEVLLDSDPQRSMLSSCKSSCMIKIFNELATARFLGNIYYWPGRRNNFFRLRSVRCFLHAAMPGAVFDGIRPLFRLKIPGELMKFWISKSPEGWQRKVHRKYEKEDWFLPENWRSMRKNLAIKKKTSNSAERNSPFWCNCATTLWIWNGMTVPVMSCRAIEFASMIGKWLKERISSHRKMYIHKWTAHCEM